MKKYNRERTINRTIPIYTIENGKKTVISRPGPIISLNSVMQQNSNSIRMIPFNDITLILTEGCNLRCSYCYENSKEYSSHNKMSWPAAKKALDFFFAQVPEKMNRTNITFFGGEPALAFDLIKKIVDYSYPHRTIRGYIGNKYNYLINTNGTILTDEMFEFYSKLGKRINIRVSADGYKDKHDLTKRTAEGKGSWFLLEKTLPRFRDLKEKYGVKVHLVTTINKSTYKDMYYNWTNLYELTGFQIASNLIHEEKWEQDDYKVIKEQALLLHEYSLRHKMKFNFTNTAGGSNTNKDDGSFRSICNAGIGSMTVNYAGDIIACHRAYYYGYSDTFKIGNLETGFDHNARNQIYEINNLKRLPSKCRECLPVIRSKCRICTASNKKAYGDFYNVPDGYCELLKELYGLFLEREAKEAEARLAEIRQRQREAVKGRNNPAVEKTFNTKGKQVNGILFFSLRPIREPQTLWQQFIDGERARGIAIAPNLITKIDAVKDVNDNAIITAIVRQSFPDTEIKELMERTIVHSFRLPDGNKGKCCIVFNRP